MSDLKHQEKMEMLMELDEQVAQIYQAVEEFLNNFGKESVLYPTRTYVQVDASELQKLAKVFYSQIS